MFRLRKPSQKVIQEFLATQEGSTFSYPEVGQSRHGLPTGYAHDHYRVKLGAGADVFAQAQAALQRWTMFQLGWVSLYPRDAPIKVGTNVAVLIRVPGAWSLNASRVAYVLDQDGPARRWGFGYGTLSEHVERGEEKFTIEWDRSGEAVWYDVAAFSRANSPLARVGYPLTRLMQKRFARDSKRAMAEAVRALGAETWRE